LADVDPSTVEGLERIAERLPSVSQVSTTDVGPDAVDSLEETLDYAKTLRGDGRLEEAAQHLQKALYLQPHWVEARLELAEVYRESGDLDRAVGEYRVALWDTESAAIHVRLAEVYIEIGEYAKAGAHAERALELRPENSEAQALLEKLKNLQP
jgi:tetratricopeptide (TPR) repeat protein